ncbi:6,7-dimethyl-8-ribityllumazine synthase [Ponticaulis sp.]|uniref:6,7-dimethyl-8-ribityllumazine synthase n=1 Tax=Ponticaulis sp. TaxID=2020902 RepID=UPI000C48F521|nr:6,7-dimethyl-8-ribityllumazine synthase [Ponticaulis sp.]MAJ08132.1 6,7-dimethyl-8-ribityllumazine synthase [Ponticaulis sp.]HBH90822.1 6,7-dimethyl-8-ribityllumazine synthase [Hyphomonadaceae bacterium]HBJ94756.1 6,7-dimethyl-8-ribityllumazine synthase [Hyphomonadaceae bacterium]|tara:strand:+ start:72803 stop:73234 length:432 start_codon:yes stop_codon:yes gene_type:complete
MGPRVLLITSRYYEKISLELEAGAMEVLEAAEARVETVEVPGAFEIPGAVAMAADSDMYDAFVTIGCVVRGETTHYDYVCGESARGLMDLTVQRRLPIGYGIITVENQEQAWARADRQQKNKGADAATAALEMLKFRRETLRG